MSQKSQKTTGPGAAKLKKVRVVGKRLSMAQRPTATPPGAVAALVRQTNPRVSRAAMIFTAGVCDYVLSEVAHAAIARMTAAGRKTLTSNDVIEAIKQDEALRDIFPGIVGYRQGNVGDIAPAEATDELLRAGVDEELGDVAA